MSATHHGCKDKQNLFMSQTIGNRIRVIKEFYFGKERGSNRKFADFMEVDPQVVSNWFGRGDGIGTSVIDQILKYFPDIDKGWLVGGNGEMLKKSLSEELSTAKAEINADSEKEWSEFVKALAENKLRMMNGIIQWDEEWTIPQEYGEKIAMLYIESRKETEYWRNKAQDLEYKLAKIEMS